MGEMNEVYCLRSPSLASHALSCFRENITLGVQAGYAHSVSGSSAEGYNGQATLNVTF